METGRDKSGRQINRLSARTVSSLSTHGYHPDGGLYLQVDSSPTKSWVFCFTCRGRGREMGLGPFALLSLAEARTGALRCRKLLHEGVDLVEAGGRAATQPKGAGQQAVTFEACAGDYIEARRIGWRKAEHLEQWRSTLPPTPSRCWHHDPRQGCTLPR